MDGTDLVKLVESADHSYFVGAQPEADDDN
jgi:hypothetical protein